MTAAQYNPNADDVIGEEWAPTVQTSKVLASNSEQTGARFLSTAAATIDTVHPYARQVSQPGLFVCEIYELGGEVPGASQTDTYRPNQDVLNDNPSGYGLWANQAGTTATGTLYQAIDEAALDTTDYLAASIFSLGARYAFRVGSAGFGARMPTAARLVLGMAATLFGTQSVRAGLRRNSDGAEWFWADAAYTIRQELTFTFPAVNPFTLRPWSQADIVAFDTDHEFVIYHPGAAVAAASRLEMARLEVDSIPEERQAIGARTVTVPGFTQFVLSKPDGTDNWAKADATTYSVYLRRVTNPNLRVPAGSVAWGTLQGSPCPNASHRAITLQINEAGVFQVGSGVEETDVAFALALVTTAVTTDLDSQVYATLKAAPVNASTVAQQEFSNHPSADYGQVRAFVRPLADTVDDLVVRVRRRSDSSVTGSPVSLTVAQARAMSDAGGGWRRWNAELTVAATLVAAAQFYAEVSTTDETGWEVLYLDSEGVGPTVTYGGSTDRATVSGVESNYQDLAVQLGVAPPPVDALTTDVDEWVVTPDGTVCSAGPVQFAWLRWVPSGLGVDFGAYRIERSEDGGVTWFAIANITTEAVTEFRDFEGLRLTEIVHRIRVVNALGVPSTPVEGDPVTLAASAAAWVFCSNEAPNLVVAYDGGPHWEVEFADAGNVVVRPIYGGEDDEDAVAVMVFRPIEHDGDRFPLSLAVNFGATPVASGRAAFAPLEELSTADLSYVCVHDWRGNRWLAAVVLTKATVDEPAHRYRAQVNVVEATSVFSTPDVVIP